MNYGRCNSFVCRNFGYRSSTIATLTGAGSTVAASAGEGSIVAISAGAGSIVVALDGGAIRS